MFKENHPGLGKDFFAVSHQSSSQFAAPLLLLSRTSQPYYNSRGYCGSQIYSAHSHHHITIRSGRHINCMYTHSLCVHMYVHMQVYVGMCRYRLIHTCKCYRCDCICLQYSMHMYIIYIYLHSIYYISMYVHNMIVQ